MLYYATGWKLMGLILAEIFEFFPIYLILPAMLSHLWADCLEDVGSSMSDNPIGLHRLLHR
jgi:hypothetical protein